MLNQSTHELEVVQETLTLNIGRTDILVVQIVGMLPHITAKKWLLTIYPINSSISIPTAKRIGSITSREDFQASILVLHKPRPSRTEVSNRNLAELLHELLYTSPLSLDGSLQLSLQFSLVGGHAIPIESVVPHLSSIIEHTSSGSLDELFQRSSSLRKQVVEVVHIATY